VNLLSSALGSYQRPTSVITLAKKCVKATLRLIAERHLSEAQIIVDLKNLGVRTGGIVLVHSSLSSLGYVRGGALTVIRALQSAIGPRGTLVIPTHSWEIMERGARVFNASETPSCVGTISEEFRKFQGVRRSLHPSHSVAALGPLSSELTDRHQYCSTPCGAGSPYENILKQGGQILFLGVTLDSNTAFHTIEAIADLPYLMKQTPDNFTIIDADGKRKELPIRRHEAGIARRFSEWENLLCENGILQKGLVGNARCLLVEGKSFLDFMMKRVGEDPKLFLCDPR